MDVIEVAAATSAEALELGRCVPGGERLYRLAESEEIAWCVARLRRGCPVVRGSEGLMLVMYQVLGECRVELPDGSEHLLLPGHYAQIPEGTACVVTALNGDAEQVVFYGVEQLPGAFFNTYQSSNAAGN